MHARDLYMYNCGNVKLCVLQVFGEALFQVVPAQLGRCFDRDAWTDCYEVIAQGIKE